MLYRYLISLALMSTIMVCPSEYKAAGVLPYAFHEGKLHMLVGSSPGHKNRVGDFGGGKEPYDAHNPFYTAAREGSEELIFIFDNDKEFEELVQAHKKYGKKFNLSKAYSRTFTYFLELIPQGLSSYSRNYVMYFIPITYNTDLIKHFCRRKKCHKHLPCCWDETSEIMWLNVDEVYVAIDKRTDKNPVTINGHILHEPFVQSLITARAAGIINRL